MLRRKSGFWISVCLLFTGLHGLIQPQIIHAQLTATNPTTFGFQSDEILPEVDPLEVEGDIVVAGSETLLPLTERLYDRFIEAGYGGIVRFMRIGTNAGFLVFCEKGTVDVVIATRRLRVVGWDNRSSSFWLRSSDHLDHFGKHQSGIYMPQGPEFIRCDYPNPLPGSVYRND
ncbi:hypothetical protein C2W62_16900 [Candidatus Entotheonella serta]|nr:hypothetical protein C2W62_16900 [Candidatus Entotheonella serta]